MASGSAACVDTGRVLMVENNDIRVVHTGLVWHANIELDARFGDERCQSEWCGLCDRHRAR